MLFSIFLHFSYALLLDMFDFILTLMITIVLLILNSVMCLFDRNGFHSGDIDVAMVGNKVTLTVGKGSTSVNVDLYEAKAAEKKSEMQNVLFRLAETSTKLDADLDKANQTIDTLKAQKGTGAAQAFMDLGPKKGLNQAKAKPSKAGMSVLNPTSKKRKAAHGVVFD
jgi:hypothetical protein